jgi:putative NADH-flavin reductase
MEEPMHIVLLGGGGHIAQRIAKEALRRKHRVTAVVRDAKSLSSDQDNLQVVQGDATDAESIARVARGADAIVNAISPRPSPSGRPASSLSDSARAVIAGAKKAGVKRLLVVGGAGSLEVAPGVQLLDAPGFPDIYRAEALAGRDSLAVYKKEAGDLEWTYISPAAEIAPGERTGKFRTGGDQLLSDKTGRSFITMEDYAVAVVDELEQRKNVGRRMTVAY